MQYILETKNLSKVYGKKTVLHGLDLQIKKGEIYALVGLNGAGKTTTIKMLLGLVQPSVGKIRILDRNFFTSKSDLLPRMGNVLENPGFYEYLTVYENLKMIVDVVGIHESENIEEALRITNMLAFKDEPVSSLGPSQRQKLALSRALINSPDILILDEPMNGLDPKSVNEIRTLLKRLSRENNLTILISSHVLTEVEKLADRIGFLHMGKMVETFDMKKSIGFEQDRLIMSVDKLSLAMDILKEAGYTCEELTYKKCTILTGQDAVNDILALMVEAGIQVEDIFLRPQSLEDLFIAIVERQS